MKNKMFKIKEGISLIVLVITIIVMIILAATIIISLNNTNIIGKASEAVDLTNEANVQEFAQTKWAEAYLKTDKSQEKLEDYVIGELEEAGIDTKEYAINITEKGVSVVKSIISTVNGVPIPKGFVASQVAGENTAAKGLVIYEGSEAVTNENVETARRSRNQYVWIPVDKDTFTTTFVRKDYVNETSKVVDSEDNYYELGTSAIYWEITNVTELNETNLQYMTKATLAEVQAMYKSVEKYGGFYIARYEAGIDKQRAALGEISELPGIKSGTKVYSMMGKIPYTHIPWTLNNALNEDTNGAVEVSRNVYSADNSNYGVISTLAYGVQWDSVMQWLVNTGTMTLDQISTLEGSTSFGNYSNRQINNSSELNDGALVWDYTASSSESYVSKDSETLTYPKESGTKWALSTGALKSANTNNIYDLAGNMWEWTVEGYSIGRRSMRGGYFCSNGSKAPASMRSYNYPDYTSNGISFRIALYIK